MMLAKIQAVFKECMMTKCMTFSGRMGRKDFWIFYSLLIVLYVSLTLLDVLLGWYHEGLGLGVVSGITFILTVIPSIAATIRRLHDTNRSGWWYLISFIPLIGVGILFVLAALKGTDGSNRYGEIPEPIQPVIKVHDESNPIG